jgi:hypothetical protein
MRLLVHLLLPASPFNRLGERAGVPGRAGRLCSQASIFNLGRLSPVPRRAAFRAGSASQPASAGGGVGPAPHRAVQLPTARPQVPLPGRVTLVTVKREGAAAQSSIAVRRRAASSMMRTSSPPHNGVSYQRFNCPVLQRLLNHVSTGVGGRWPAASAPRRGTMIHRPSPGQGVPGTLDE